MLCADGGKHHKSHNSFGVYNAFETLNNTKVTAQIGGTAVLPCIVEASSPATVTWIRRSDYRLLTGFFIIITLPVIIYLNGCAFQLA